MAIFEEEYFTLKTELLKPINLNMSWRRRFSYDCSRDFFNDRAS